MKEKIKDLWVGELKSGQWNKTEGALCDDNGEYFCCLGVLTELYIREKNQGYKQKQVGWRDSNSENGFNEAAEGLPEEVQEWAGIRSDLGKIENHRLYDSLAHINDDSESFKPVVKAIEEHWVEL